MEGKLSVALPNVLPYAKLEVTKATGVDGDIVNAIAEMECLTVAAKSVTAAASIPTPRVGRADLSIGAWYRTAARAQVVSPTDQMAIVSIELGSNTVTVLAEADRLNSTTHEAARSLAQSRVCRAMELPGKLLQY